MFALLLLTAPRKAFRMARRCFQVLRMVSTAQVLVLTPLVLLLTVLPWLLFPRVADKGLGQSASPTNSPAASYASRDLVAEGVSP